MAGWATHAMAESFGFDGLAIQVEPVQWAFDPADEEPGPEFVREHEFQLVGVRWRDEELEPAAEVMYREPEGLFTIEEGRLLSPFRRNGLYVHKLWLELGRVISLIRKPKLRAKPARDPGGEAVH